MTWVTLASKIDVPKEMKDFRPISMVESVYKVILKILVLRMKNVMSFLVGEVQYAFIQDRQILDGALIASETVSWLKKSKKSGVIVKLDFKKSYDTVRWSFLDHVLKIMGFSDIWRKWINEMLNTVAMSIIVNRSPIEPFAMERGLRQGDPILLFLFILVAEVLN
ncbi:secreted RxLR effector protein 78-like [Arachis duranensis]|uniref:Secreted RxLR effector protein 78-like n=1 Tax=Arachis duranensis TaxID=130453 RepID=A0A6P4DRL4_ARADU|nr:secreted RxLR effector protein 78-like [Arachis duranensis]